LEQEDVDAVVGELALRVADRRLERREVGRRGQLGVDVAELLAVVLEIIVGVGVDADVERLDVADDREVVVLVLVDARQPLRPFDVLDLRLDSDLGEFGGDDFAAAAARNSAAAGSGRR
jgi:hypothetical protein